jgi:hypothetical protein
MLLSFPDLIQWCIKRQKFLGWTNQVLADKSKVPVGTINRIKAGDYMDCKYSTIKQLLVTLIGGTTDEFSCTEQVEKELHNLEQLEQQAAKLSMVEAENAMLKEKLRNIDELHRQDIRIIKQEFQEQKQEYKETIAFLREEIKERRNTKPNKE